MSNSNLTYDRLFTNASLAYVNRITKGREQIVNKTIVKMMDELGYDVELTYKRKSAEAIAR